MRRWGDTYYEINSCIDEALLISLTIILGCTNHKHEDEKFEMDHSQISSNKVHSYEFYKNGKVKIDRSETISYLHGFPFDTLLSKELYKYNSNGKTLSITNLIDSSRRVKVYNDLDSLVGDFAINKAGDTTMLRITKYKDGNRVGDIMRFLSSRISINPGDFQPADFKTYDTLFQNSELVHNTKEVKVEIKKNSKGEVTEEYHFTYNGNKLEKTEKYTFIGPSKYLSEVTILDTNVGNDDYITTDVQGDRALRHEQVARRLCL